MRTVIHIGLHKTGTKWFQNYVFPNINSVVYNPKKLNQYAADYIKADNIDKPGVMKLFLEEKKLYYNKNLLISREIFSGNLFTAYDGWNESVVMLHDLYPEAKIWIFFRYQTDWLLSCYKESICEHHYQSVDQFLKSLDPYNLDYVKMLRHLYRYYKNVSVFFFEDVFKGKHTPTIIPNRGYSSLAVKLSLLRYKLFPNLVHRPIKFLGSGSIPCGKEVLSCLDKEKYWSGFLRDNEEIRSVNYPNLTGVERIRMELTWRHFIKQRFDKVLYYNKDLFSKHRSVLDGRFKEMNKEFKKMVKNLPDVYTVKR